MGNTTPVLNDSYRVDANILTGVEKAEIFSKQCIFAKEERNIKNEGIEDVIRKSIQGPEGPIGFPLCAHLYVCSDKYKSSEEMFFSKPTKYLKLQI